MARHYTGFFVKPRTPQDIMAEALALRPCAVFVGFSGGDDSLTTTHWMMNNVPNCEVFHANTGIGIEKTREFVRETCRKYNWPLNEIRAKEDCGNDYDEEVIKHGFPGPFQHTIMYSLFKQSCVNKLVHDRKKGHKDKVIIAAGIRYDESRRRARYAGKEVDVRGSQIWVNPLYWWTKTQFMDYIKDNGLKRNPVSEMLGMSGECLCGAYIHKGAKALVRIVDPATADRIENLEKKVREAGHDWGWEENSSIADPEMQHTKEKERGFFMPFCMGCEK